MAQHILVIDDDPLLQALLRELLESEDYQVDTANDGLEALTQLDSRPGYYDVILLDLIMPRLGGLPMLHILQQRAWPWFATIIACSGDDGALREAAGFGIGASLSKPFGLHTLLSLVARIVQGPLADARLC